MQLLDLTLPTPAENLGLDEALLDAGEQGQLDDDILRLWDAESIFVVLGRSGKLAREIHVDRCSADGVPLLRRSSGGGTVVAAPGCMFFSMVLSMQRNESLRMVDNAHQYVMNSVRSALLPVVPGLEIRGTCDLTLDGRKISGNSLRIRRNWLLYHGTLLLNMNLDLLPKYLQHPPREPDYREGREHSAFVANLSITRSVAATALIEHMEAHIELATPPLAEARRLAAEKFSNAAWTHSR
ncbi:MAG: lipoate--protein ligase family protein [Aureliella sp.]